MTDWFSKWFDSKYYHILYKNRDSKEAAYFLKNLSKLKFFKKEVKIIDIACGTGRHSLLLAKLGYNVTGIDLSKNSIKYAKKFENENLVFDVSDMRETYQKNGFDIALNLFTSFGYFDTKEDNQKAILAIRDSLKKDGILIIDFLNSKKVISNLVKKECKKINDVTFNISRSFRKGFIEKNIEVRDGLETYFFNEKVQAFSENDLSSLLTSAGMKIINTFGNYKLNKFNLSTSERLIILAQKCN